MGSLLISPSKGQQLQHALEGSFRSLYQFIGASLDDTIVFTSSGAEAVNQVIQSVYENITLNSGKNHFLTSSLDEAPSILSINKLESLGCVSKMIPASPNCHVTPEALIDSLHLARRLFPSLGQMPLTGVIQPVEEIAKICRQRGILFHLDATQILGKLYFELSDLKADFITFNGSQFHAPKGTGGLYVRNGVKLSPLIIGGSEQAGKRAGEVNIPGLVGLASAAQEALQSRDYLGTEIARLRDKLEQGVIAGYPEAELLFNNENRLPHTTAIAFPGIVNEAFLFALNRKGVCATIGGNTFQQLSLSLMGCQIGKLIAQSALSFSLFRYTGEEEINQAIALIVETAQMLSKISSCIIKEAS